MLKDLFGGDAMVENVKIVPDRNVCPPFSPWKKNVE
jgi:hypothetical protein